MKLKRNRSSDGVRQMMGYAFDKAICLFGKIVYVLSIIGAFIVSFYDGDHTTALLLIIAAGVYLNLVLDLEKEINIKYRFK